MLENTVQGIGFNFYGISGTLVKSVRAEQGQNEIDLGEPFNGVYLFDCARCKITKTIN
jgi:hypothetical protein